MLLLLFFFLSRFWGGTVLRFPKGAITHGTVKKSNLYVLHFGSFKPLKTQKILTGRYIDGVSLIYLSFNVNFAWLYLYQFLQEVPYA